MGGNRSILVDHDLSGIIAGLTLATRPEEVYRALIEATAFGTRLIIETFEKAGIAIVEFIVAGGLKRNALLLQIYADVLRRPISVAASDDAPALGSAIHAAVAAGAYADVLAASAAMGRVESGVYQPDDGNADVYDQLFAEYRQLHDTFGPDGMLHRLRRIRNEARK
jgi:L-ribulokinase